MGILKKRYSRIGSKIGSKLLQHLESVWMSNSGVLPGYRCKHPVVTTVLKGQPHRLPGRLGHVRVSRQRRVVQLMLTCPVWEVADDELRKGSE